MPAGRPSEYTKEIGEEFCSRLSKGKSMRTVCKDDDMPSAATIFKWMRDNPEFLKQYEQAKVNSADAHLETIEELGDLAIEEAKTVDPKSSNAVVSAYKLKADNLKWYMSKLKPKKYGEKLDVTSDGKPLPTPIYGAKSNKKV